MLLDHKGEIYKYNVNLCASEQGGEKRSASLRACKLVACVAFCLWLACGLWLVVGMLAFGIGTSSVTCTYGTT